MQEAVKRWHCRNEVTEYLQFATCEKYPGWGGGGDDWGASGLGVGGGWGCACTSGGRLLLGGRGFWFWLGGSSIC